MLVRFWGTRGSIPTPGPGTARFGGNTSCVELQTEDGNLFVFDCGTGIRELGISLLGRSATPPRIHILIGHTHWDHIQGFPFFTPVFLPGTEINIYAPLGFQRSLEDAMSGQMQYSYFPVKLDELSSRIHYTELDEGFFRIGNSLVETQYLNHTAPTIGYRITEGSTSVAYVTDHEPFWQSSGPVFQHPGDQLHVEFIRDADLLIHDAQYSEEEYKGKIGWGHSPVGYVRDVALAADVKRLALFHHDPTHDDAWIEETVEGLRRSMTDLSSPIDVFAAAEQMELQIQGDNLHSEIARESALEHRSTLGQRVLFVSSDPNDFTLMERTLVEDGLILMPASDATSALKRCEEFAPVIAIVDGNALEVHPQFVQTLRQKTGNPDLPVVLLTQGHDLGSAKSGFVDATDYLERPFSPPMLRTRVRAWISRTVLEKQAARSTSGSRRDKKPAPATPETSGGNYTDVLKQTALFQHLDVAQLDDLISNASEQVFPPGYPILSEGDAGTSVFIIVSGRVRIVEAVPDGPTDMFLGELGAGEIFGEIGFLRDSPRSATVATLEQTRCLVLPQADFLITLESSPALCIALLRVLAGRLAEADRLLARYAPDPLTGLPGRRAFHDLYHRLAAGARRRGNSAILVLIDINNLRGINADFGFTVGDDVLKATAEALRKSSRTTDLIARYGSDEFAVLLTDADPKVCDQITGRINEHVATLAKQQLLPPGVRFDIGIAISEQAPETVDGLLRMADEEIQKKKARKTQSTS
jgi:diguanylate cyclase (GGDEF)-like protein